MKIVAIFAEKLYSFSFEGESVFSEMLNKWNDAEYINDYYKDNEQIIENNPYVDCRSKKEFRERIVSNAEDLDLSLLKLVVSNKLDDFFEVLSINEPVSKLLSKRKGKQMLLRIYALKIDKNVFVITGGAIKLTQKMQDHSDTNKELKMLDKCRNFLQENRVFDCDSFFEFINEH